MIVEIFQNSNAARYLTLNCLDGNAGDREMEKISSCSLYMHQHPLILKRPWCEGNIMLYEYEDNLILLINAFTRGYIDRCQE